ncbi:MAG: peptidoglycan-binding protein LysM [Sphingobacteriales bacterium]|nr:MAG: peptidoglycan-binding protein LysM [Sphingobacteriales bacterium]
MGLISFMKNAGAKLFGRKDETAEKKEVVSTTPVLSQEELDAQKALLLESEVRKFGLNIEDLYIQVNDETAIVHGKAYSVSDKEKAILVCGNVDGIAYVEDRISLPEDRSVEQTDSQYYTVVKGDTLSKIAKEFYGNANKYMVIFEANKPMLSDPDKIYPGQVLRIPAL